MWPFLALIVIGLVQLALGFVGIEHHFGVYWAVAALVVAFWFRFLLPITIGSYFGAVDVMGWEWYVGVAVAAPGLFFVLPGMVMAALESLKQGSNGTNSADWSSKMVKAEKPVIYWGVVTFAFLWALIMLILNAAAGSHAGNFITVLWLWVCYLGFRGDAQSILTLAKYVLILQIVLGGLLFVVLLNNTSMQLHFGTPEVFLLSLAIPTLAWAILYWWVSSKVEAIDTQRNAEHPLDDVGARGLTASSTPLNDTAISQKKYQEKEMQHASSYPKNDRKINATGEPARAMDENKLPNEDITFNKDAEIIMEYVVEAKSCYERLALFPSSIKAKYQELIAETGGADPEKSFREAIVLNLGVEVQYDASLDEAIKKVTACGSKEIEEFIKVFPVLSKSMKYQDIAQAVCRKFEDIEPEIIIVRGASSAQKRVYVHSSGRFSLFLPNGEREYFERIEDVYDYLGTPQLFRKNI